MLSCVVFERVVRWMCDCDAIAKSSRVFKADPSALECAECFWLVPTLSKLGYMDILLRVFCWQNPPSAADGTSHVWYRSTILLKPLLGTRLVEDIVYLFVTSLYASVVSHVFSCYELPYLLWAWLDGTNVLTLTLLLVDFNIITYFPAFYKDGISSSMRETYALANSARLVLCREKV